MRQTGLRTSDSSDSQSRVEPQPSMEVTEAMAKPFRPEPRGVAGAERSAVSLLSSRSSSASMAFALDLLLVLADGEVHCSGVIQTGSGSQTGSAFRAAGFSWIPGPGFTFSHPFRRLPIAQRTEGADRREVDRVEILVSPG